MYYLQSRYYDPEVCRFINADNTDNLAANGDFASYNLYAYCGNNPVARKDDGGDFWHIVAGAVVGGAISFVTSVMHDVSSGNSIDWTGALISTAFGAASGALAATGLGAVAQIALGAVLSGAESAIAQGRESGFNNIDYGEVVLDAAIGGISSINKGISKGDSKHLMRHGINATKRVFVDAKNNGLKAAGKYYVSQSNTMFYQPLLKSAGYSLASSSVVAVKNVVMRAFV